MEVSLLRFIFSSKKHSKSTLDQISEEGLDKARTVTAALYDGDFTALASLTEDEMFSLFTGATHCEILIQPGMSALDLALKAKCFKHERK